MKKLYFILDGDDIGKAIEAGIIEGEPESVAWISPRIQSALECLIERIKSEGGEILLRGCDDLLGLIPETSTHFLRGIPEKFLAETTFSVSVGIGQTSQEAFLALKLAKSQGKRQCVTWSSGDERDRRQSD